MDQLTFAYNLGLAFSIIIAFDIGFGFLWIAGRKESLRRQKRRKGQRWYAHRLWKVSSFCKFILFYVFVLGWMYAARH